jgi:hypothetical protein
MSQQRTFVVIYRCIYQRPWNIHLIVVVLACIKGYLNTSMGIWSLTGTHVHVHRSGYYNVLLHEQEAKCRFWFSFSALNIIHRLGVTLKTKLFGTWYCFLSLGNWGGDLICWIHCPILVSVPSLYTSSPVWLKMKPEPVFKVSFFWYSTYTLDNVQGIKTMIHIGQTNS